MPAEPDFVACRECVCSRIRKASRAITQHYEQFFHGSGLRSTQFNLLTTLIQTGPLPMTRLAAMLGLERTTLTRNLAPLAKQKLVRLNETEDGRVHKVEITRKGEAAARAAYPRWKAAQDSVEKLLTKFRVSLR
ncbi:MAG TPA: MarR family winged helix-turn-helix transcriptional regulator [Bryobacteraceae bacterium]|jgi:DNA-binding MarR family transcriptional regulator|nr:MarR family winged helix-turn-helix transcriptional regulator [Bryobacteraceae bacterium]